MLLVMRSVVFLSVAALAVFRATSIASAQHSVADSARCAAALNGPTKDSAIVEMDAIFSTFDSRRVIPDEYRALLGEGLRESLVLPRPLTVGAYDDSLAAALVAGAKHGEYANATLRSYYRLTLRRDGRLTNARAVGGGQSAAFDDAIVSALVTLDSNRLLPPPRGMDSVFDGDTLPILLTIRAGSEVSTKLPSGPSPRVTSATPLLQLRLPLYRVEKRAVAVPGNVFPRYPYSMRSGHIEGEVQLEFLVRSDGTVDPGSIQAIKATSIDFLQSVITVLPAMHFYPMRIAGCDVAAWVHMPFVFSLQP